MANNRQRITLFFRYLGGGGAERVMLNLSRGLIQFGFQVDVVLGKAWGPHLDKIPSQVRVVDLKASGLFTTTIALAKYLRQEQPEALISALHYANEISLWAKKISRVSTKVLVTEHNTFSLAIQHTSRSRKRLIPIFIKYCYPWADKIVAVSKGAAQDLSHSTGLPIERIQTVYNPVITPELLEQAKEPIEHPWFAPGEPPVILGVGKLEAQKDFPTLIRAFAEVRQSRQIRLMILGWGPELPKLDALIKQLNLESDISLLGYVDNPFPYMSQASVFVLSSAWEGLPTVLIEAMAVGTSVVSTNCKSGAAEILDYGKYGLLTPVGDASALAAAISKTLDTKENTENLTWLKQFKLEEATEGYLSVLDISI